MNRISVLTGGCKAGCSKRSVQQGRRAVGVRSVHGVREYVNGPRTPLAAFFNILLTHRGQLRLDGRLAKFFQGQYFDLPDPFARHVQEFPHFFERTGFSVADAET